MWELCSKTPHLCHKKHANLFVCASNEKAPFDDYYFYYYYHCYSLSFIIIIIFILMIIIVIITVIIIITTIINIIINYWRTSRTFHFRQITVTSWSFSIVILFLRPVYRRVVIIIVIITIVIIIMIITIIINMVAVVSLLLRTRSSGVRGTMLWDRSSSASAVLTKNEKDS